MIELMSGRKHAHLGQLDSLRGLAVLGVLMVHAAMWPTRVLHGPLFSTFQAGQRGVQLFFLISAFTLFLSNDQRRDEARPTLNFFLRRFFRLTPMYYVATALAVMFWPYQRSGPGVVLWNLAYLGGFSAKTMNQGAVGSWSVADEAIFYLLLPFFFRAIRTSRAALLWFAASVPLLHLLTQYLATRSSAPPEYWTMFSFPAELPVFLLGVLGYFLWKDFVRDNSWTTEQRRFASGSMLVVVAILAWYMLPISSGTLVAESLCGLLLLLSLVVHPRSVLTNRFTVFLGKISYSVYLLHFYVRLLVDRELSRHLQGSWITRHNSVLTLTIFLVTLAGTLPFAAAAWYFIEEPGIRAGRRLIAALEHRHLRPTEAALIVPLKATVEPGNSADAQF